jgi:glucose/mannose-6-phosphate isomerase
MISSTSKTAHARAIVPNLAVFSLRCGVSATKDAGIATHNLASTPEGTFSRWRGWHWVKDESYCGKQHPHSAVALNLDDISAISEIDRSHMLALMEKTPRRLLPPADAQATCGKRMEQPRNVVFGGVGGSGIIGSIVADYLRSVAVVPVSVCRSLQIPACVGEGTLFVAISYSGETVETISMFDQAVRSDAAVISVSSGGTLLAKSKKNKIGYLKVPESLLPRVAFPELIAAVLYAVGSAGLIENAQEMLLESAETLQTQIREIGPDRGLRENTAKQLATAIQGKLPVLFGNEDKESVLRRFKNELNENSKMPAFCYTLPEACHNDIEGLEMLTKLAQPQPILLIERDESELQRRTRERLHNLLTGLGFNVLEFKGLGENRMQRLLTAVMVGDYVSVYLALLRGVDPSDLSLIPSFRKAMRSS